MIPIKPFSVKFPPEVRSLVKEASQDLGYSENHFILASVVSVLDMINQEGAVTLPKVVSLAKAARDHKNSPPILFQGKPLSSAPASKPPKRKLKRKRKKP